MKCSWIRVSTDRCLACRPGSAERLVVNLLRGERTISGFNLALLSGSKIVQAWRATGWWPNHYSIAIFDIKKVPGGSRLEFTQIGIPPNRYSGHYRGWIEAYWTPMKEVFERGKISENTRRRVRKSRDQRIKTGKFRRKISVKI